MRQLMILAVAALIAEVGSAGLAWAACPGESDDGKRLTVKGTVNFAEKDPDGGYGYGIEECPIYIMSNRNDGGACKVGSKISATGKFFSCEADFLGECDPDFGDPDWMEEAKVSCR